MGTAVRRTSADLIDVLTEQAPAFEFFQAVHLLELSAGTEGQPRAELDVPVRFRCAPELSCPGGDIRRCRLDEQRRLVFELGFMGLYGVDAAVPHYFLEAVARDDEVGRRLGSFLDLFNHRLYELLYLAWRKHRGHLRADDRGSLFRRYLGALGGGGETRPWLELAFAGPLGGRVRSSAGLAGVLDEFYGVPTQVRQFVPAWIEIDELPALGGDMVLGENSLLGQRMLDFSRKVELNVGPVTWERAALLLPGGEQAQDLAHLIRAYLDPSMEFDLILHVDFGCRAALRLGDASAVLGWTTSLGTANSGTQAIRLPGHAYAAESSGPG